MNQEYIPKNSSRINMNPTKQVRLRAFDPMRVDASQEYLHFKSGGLVSRGALHEAAEKVRSSGRHNDDILVHVNEDEYKKMCQEFGDPITNPETGIPEWGFFDSLKKVFKKVAPVLSVLSLVPGLQFLSPLAAMGKGVTALTGLTGATANALGGAALGGITGGSKGAIVGGIGGFAGTPGTGGNPSPLQQVGGTLMPNASQGTQMAIGRGLAGAASAKVMGGDPLQGALSSALTGGMIDKFTGSNLVNNKFMSNHPMLQQAALGAARGADMAGMTGGDLGKGATYGATIGAANAALSKLDPIRFGTRSHTAPADPNAPADPAKQASPAQLQSNLTNTPDYSWFLADSSQYKTKQDALTKLQEQLASNPDQRPVYDAMSRFTLCDNASDFGSCLSQNWTAFNQSIAQNAPKLVAGSTNYAEGGKVDMRTRIQDTNTMDALFNNYISGRDDGHVKGLGDGQDDLIDAKLANDEFVIPADVVSALGSGSSEAGAKALHGMLQQIRKEYRGAKPDQLPPKARSPLEYIMRGE